MGKNAIRINCNPYDKTIAYFWLEEDGHWSCIVDDDNSPLADEKYTNASLSQRAYEILNVIIENYCANPDIQYTLVFEGTDDDFKDLKNVKESFFPDANIIFELGGLKINAAYEVMPEIEKTFDELNQYFKSYPDKEIEAEIVKYNETVKEQIALCVMGLYSSGKSAFINSLIGRELLPSDSDPATAKVYKVTQRDKHEIRFTYNGEKYTIVFEKNTWKCSKNPNSAIMHPIITSLNAHRGESRDSLMYWTIYELNLYAKEEGHKRHKELVECAEAMIPEEKRKGLKEDKLIELLLSGHSIEQLLSIKKVSQNSLGNLIEIDTDFYASSLPINRFEFVIYDTPGSNSAMFREHVDILKEALKKQTNGLPIFVTNPDTMDETDNSDIISIISELGGALDITNMLMVVNKSDDKSASTLKKKSENKDNLIVTKWKASKVFFASAIMGLGSKLASPNEKTSWINEDYYSTFYEKIGKFTDANHPNYMELYKYNILQLSDYKDMCSSMEALGEDSLLCINSGLAAIEREICIFANRNALYNKCTQAKLYLLNAVTCVTQKVEEKQDEIEEKRKKIAEQLSSSQEKLLEDLRDKCSKLQEGYLESFIAKVTGEITKNYLDREKIRSLINTIYSGCSGKRDHDKVPAFNRDFESKLKSDIDSYAKTVKPGVEKYWNDCAQNMREELIKIVLAAPELTETQKNILVDTVMKVSPILAKHDSVNIEQNSKVVRNKDKHFLWWYFTDIDLSEATDAYRAALKNDISTTNSGMKNSNMKTFGTFISSIITALEGNVSKFNPTLVKLSNELDTLIADINQRKQQLVFISEKKERIESILEFVER